KEASFKQLKAVPGIGKKRAATIFRKRPKTKSDLECIIDNKEELKKITKFIEFEGD
ncbi:MAG: hypothetical protein ACOC5D_02080, partial [Thermoplasmatota archaeon]